MTSLEIRDALDAHDHLRHELARVVTCLRALLRDQRSRGRTPIGDPLHGLIIEEGEAEGLIAQLQRRLMVHPGPREGATSSLARLFPVSGHEALPLARVASRFDLSDAEYAAVLLALAVEWDARFGRLVAYLNDNVSQNRPTIGLALALSDSTGDGPSPLSLLEGPAVQDGLLIVEGDGPAPGRSLRLADDVALRLQGEVGARPGRIVVRPIELGLLRRLVLDETTRRPLAAWCAGIRRGDRMPVLLLAGAEGSGKSTIAHACASEIGRRLATARVPARAGDSPIRDGRREARWYDSALLLTLAPQDEWDPKMVWEELSGVVSPLIIAGSPNVIEHLLWASPAEAALVQVPEPDVGTRSALWRRLLPPNGAATDADLDALATGFRFGPGRIARSIAHARARLALAPAVERRLGRKALGTACREVGAAAMSQLAEKLPLVYRLADLVVPTDVERELALALSWIIHRRLVLQTWGFGARTAIGGGLTALFTGPPGCGKTMAAQALIGELSDISAPIDLYRVDLSRVLSKWIGETERNLSQLFDEAQASGCALFFDEADALFGKRSEVRNAHDRYANVEIGYLLQRMERFDSDGITILCTNRPGDLDEAFLRRFQVNIQFPMPGATERARIWRAVFPTAAHLDEDLDLAVIARSFDLSGGEIRNAALAAAYLAAAEGTSIGNGHVTRAALREMRKAGRVLADQQAGS